MDESDTGHVGGADEPMVTVDLAEVPADRPSTVILETVMELSGKDVTEIPPLTETVNPDALDSLFRYETAPGLASDGGSGARNAGGAVRLTVDQFVVTVVGDGTIEFAELDSATSAAN